ncbi:ferrous iron transport protein A [Anaerofustis sp.]|uniref:FeoA family protein n=1 Tax=Anaerofustis sp. TaxID=1872517 RepID=UPI0025C27435|nr:ferrous iron transport protein A [Anaerofustis sp.]
MTLDKLQIGQKAIIKSTGGSKEIRRRLLDIGLIPKTVVLMRKVAPLGDPIEINLRGFELTLRKEDAKKIEVEVIENE